jgi:two-component system, NarL family, sensor kinase
LEIYKKYCVYTIVGWHTQLTKVTKNMKMSTTKIISTAAISIFYLATAQAQVNKTDSIDKVLKSMKEDTAKVNLLVETGKAQTDILPDKAFNYCQQAIELSKKIDYPLGLANAYCLKGSCYASKNEIKTAISNYQLADSIYHKYKGRRFKEGSGTILLEYGVIQHHLGNYLEAIQFYIRSSKIFDSLNNKTVLPTLYGNLSSLYSYLQQFDKAEFYARQCVKLAEETNNAYYTSLGNIYVATTLIQQEKYKEVLPHILKAKKIAERMNDHYLLSTCYSNLGQYYGYCKLDFTQAISNIKMAIEQSKLIDNHIEEVVDILNIFEFYYYGNQFEKARITAMEAYEISHKFKFTNMEQLSLNDLSRAEVQIGDYKKAYEHLLQSTEIKDSVFKDNSQKQINHLEALYQSEKKEKEINQLQNEKLVSELTIKRRNVVIYALFVTIALLIGMSFLFYRNIRNKRIIVEQDLVIERQKTKELEKEHQISAAHAVLQGEETERQRLARDLHDGLGGLLSGVKLKLTNIKGNYVLPEEYVNHFDNALGLLDNSIGELRRVAHNMMPESLVKYGLKDALQDFCDQIDSNKKVKIHFQFFGEEKRFESSIENTVYRIAQELINNSLKHAEASELMVQLILKEERVHLTVQDNGKGFDITLIDETKSSGLRNIRSRVDTFNGRIDLNSSPGKGTEVTVEFSC